MFFGKILYNLFAHGQFECMAWKQRAWFFDHRAARRGGAFVGKLVVRLWKKSRLPARASVFRAKFENFGIETVGQSPVLACGCVSTRKSFVGGLPKRYAVFMPFIFIGTFSPFWEKCFLGIKIWKSFAVFCKMKP